MLDPLLGGRRIGFPARLFVCRRLVLPPAKRLGDVIIIIYCKALPVWVVVCCFGFLIKKLERYLTPRKRSLKDGNGGEKDEFLSISI